MCWMYMLVSISIYLLFKPQMYNIHFFFICGWICNPLIASFSSSAGNTYIITKFFIFFVNLQSNTILVLVRKNGIFSPRGIGNTEMETGLIELLEMDTGRPLARTKRWRRMKSLLDTERHLFSTKESLPRVTKPIGLCMNFDSTPLLGRESFLMTWG